MFKQTLLLSSVALLLALSGCNENNKEKTTTKSHHKEISSNTITLSPIDTNSTIEIKKTANGFVLKNDPKKILIFDIYATWCPPCRAEAKVLWDIQKKMQKDVVVIGLSIEENITNKKLQAYKQKYQANYILTNSPKNQEMIDEIAKNLKIGKRFPIPLVALYKDGKLINFYSGATEEEFILSDIKQAKGK
ncbi:PUTATIVE LIPOPROTEIN THIREDOXIN [hydrothermal vent metagenome]|uniref:PUTATIVE LIPOPROTEIN THIREDOXIN n=1 Tax=hydrothermal vent metagenome TaxID=652676 RepID=A0A1W1B9K6_9ZZZZ